VSTLSHCVAHPWDGSADENGKNESERETLRVGEFDDCIEYPLCHLSPRLRIRSLKNLNTLCPSGCLRQDLQGAHKRLCSACTFAYMLQCNLGSPCARCLESPERNAEVSERYSIAHLFC
jgi:hypothetical protein